MGMMHACPFWGRNRTVQETKVLRPSTAHYRSVDILEAVTCFRVCLYSILYLELHLCSNCEFGFFFPKNEIPSLLR